MYKLNSLPETISLFPLGNALLLPHSRLPLNIFEPRYLSLLDDTMKSDHRLIGMVQPLSPNPKNGDLRVHKIGCAGRLTSFSETGDGRYMVTLTGICRFRVTNLIDGFLSYPTANINWDSFGGDLKTPNEDQNINREKFFDVLERYFKIMELSTDWDGLKDADDMLLINSLAMLCPFEPEEKQALLEAPSLDTRRETLVTLMEFALRDENSTMDKIQ
ncbi:LON peptidase substrate-binding domain-containing protein [Amylibacter sp.]|nr:LON peptidase substrate-binding domain-containing protein [Amylibacter sp.]